MVAVVPGVGELAAVGSARIPIGIDLGTTFSAVSYVDHAGHTLVIRNAEGDILTPSVVLFGDNEVVVGKEARSL